MDAQRTVLVGTFGTGLVTAVGTVGKRGTLPSSRVVAGTFVSAVMLSLLAEAAPKVAAGIAATMLISSLFVFGGDTFATIARLTSATGPGPSLGGIAGAGSGAVSSAGPLAGVSGAATGALVTTTY